MEQQYKEARIEFLKSSLRKDDNQKIDDLKKIIELGKKLNKDVRPDEKKLAVLNKSIKVINNKNIESAQTSSNNKQNKEKQSNFLYSIKNVTTSNNSIVVDFNVDIKDDKFKLPSFPVRAVDDVLNTGGTEEPELTPEEEAMMKKIK